MMRKALILLILCGLFFAGCGLVRGERVLEEQNGEIATSGIRLLSVNVEAGLLQVIGTDDDVVIYEAEFVGNSTDQLDGLDFDYRAEGGTLTITTRTGRVLRRDSGRIDLTLYVPAGLDLDIRDKSGLISVVDMEGSVDIHDGSGDIEVENVGQELTIDDGSGDIEVENVGGDLTIDDESGTIHVSGVGGNLTITDTSGDISVDDIQGDFEVLDDTSGRIEYKAVSGNVVIPED